MRTLVVHPEDKSTDFLCPIYEGIKDKTVMRTGTRDEVIQAIKQHERVLMMGHGAPNGLFGMGFRCGLIIDYSMVELLKDKTENMYIWCHADQFVRRHDLKGFYTGMFISEISEAHFNYIYPYPGEVKESNKLFSQLVGEIANERSDIIHAHVKKHYVKKKSRVMKYNNDRLYLASPETLVVPLQQK